MDETAKIHVGGGLKDASARMLDAVARFERGESVSEEHISFERWAALFSTLTPKRYALLRHVHRHPEKASGRLRARSIAIFAASMTTCGRWPMPVCWKPTRAEYEAVEVAPARIAL